MKRLVFPLAIGLLVTAPASWGVTADELRQMTNTTEHEDEARAARAKTDNPSALLPPRKPATDAPVQSNKYGTAPAGDRSSSQTAPSPSGINYAPVSAPAAGKDAIFSDSVPPPKQLFGIRLGQWFHATLERNTSSAEPGLVELRVTNDVIGDKRTLSAGTLLYASKALNGSTKRLEMQVVKGITPDGHEFKMKGLIFDVQKVSGLDGIMQVNKSQIAQHSVTNAALAAIGAGAQSIMPGNPIGAATRGAAETALTDTNRGTEFNTSVREVIYVSPQPVFVHVEETF